LVFGKELHDSHPNNVVFKKSLAISYEKLGVTHTSLGNLNKALKFFEDETDLFEELYESNPSNVKIKNGLAVSYILLGALYVNELNNANKGIDFLNKAKVIYKELVDKHPQYTDFKNNYNWVIKKIESITSTKP